VLREVYGELERVAAAVSRTQNEARDLVQSVLLDAIERGVADLSAPERRAWLRGALRRRAAFDARTAGRARRRDARWLEASSGSGEAGETARPWRFSRDFLERLAPSLRTLAALASAELEPREIRSVLRLSDTAFRKRVSMLRRALGQASAAGVSLVTAPSQAFALGKQRALVIAGLRRHPGWAIASHDPDGHPLVFTTVGAHEKAPGGNSE
jgi:DNA-directed RNA polymerase specialized sigma24 family protein